LRPTAVNESKIWEADRLVGSTCKKLF